MLDAESRDVPYDLTSNQAYFEQSMPMFVSRNSEKREHMRVFSGASNHQSGRKTQKD